MEKNTATRLVTALNNQIKDLTYELKEAVVAAVLDNGATWPEIGAALGISKQTAHARYGQDVSVERSSRKWAEENPERHAAAVAKGEAAAAAMLAEINARHWTSTPKISDTDVAGESATPSIFSDTPKAPALNDWEGAIDSLGRQVYWLEGPADATAQPGTGVGDHNCPRCQSMNHKGGAWHTVAAFPECEPTRFDPQNIVDWFYRSMKITKTTASDQG